ncbi:MAG: PEGA domain-containing protein [Myxococcales bacterium]|nr:PEGA domain-containing protein [Myxococcales bacterium]
MPRLIFALLLAFAPALVHAQSAADRAQARTLNSEGAKAYRAKQYQTALEKFSAANELVPDPTLDVNIGRCYEALDQSAKAMVHCKIALNARNAPEPVRAAARECVERVSARLVLPTLEVTSAPKGAKVLIDGEVVGETPWTGQVDPGRRQIDLELAGHGPVSQAVVTEYGGTYKVKEVLVPTSVGGLLTVTTMPEGCMVTLDGALIGTTPLTSYQLDARRYVLEVSKEGFVSQVLAISVEDGRHLRRTFTLLPRESEVAGRLPRWPGWVLVGLGVASIGVGSYFGWQALDARQEADQLARTSNLPEDRPRYESLVSEMDGHVLAADVMIYSGSAVIVGGLTWLLWPDAED